MQRVRPENRLSARFACFQIPVYSRDFKISNVLQSVLDGTRDAYLKQISREDFVEDFSQELNPRTGRVMAEAHTGKAPATASERGRRRTTVVKAQEELPVDAGAEQPEAVQVEEPEQSTAKAESNVPSQTLLMAEAIIELLMGNVGTVLQEECALRNHAGRADKAADSYALTAAFKGLLAPDKSKEGLVSGDAVEVTF